MASELESRATALGVPRYVSEARLLGHRADRALGRPVDPGAVEADLDLLDASVAIEAWWWTGEVAADFANPAWLDRAVDRADRLAGQAGGYAGRAAAARGPAPGRLARPGRLGGLASPISLADGSRPPGRVRLSGR